MSFPPLRMTSQLVNDFSRSWNYISKGDKLMEGFCSFLLRVCSLWKGIPVKRLFLLKYIVCRIYELVMIICGRQILFKVDKFFPGFINSFRVHFGTHFKIHWRRPGYSSLFFYSPFQCAPVNNEIEGAQGWKDTKKKKNI